LFEKFSGIPKARGYYILKFKIDTRIERRMNCGSQLWLECYPYLQYSNLPDRCFNCCYSYRRYYRISSHTRFTTIMPKYLTSRGLQERTHNALLSSLKHVFSYPVVIGDTRYLR